MYLSPIDIERSRRGKYQKRAYVRKQVTRNVFNIGHAKLVLYMNDHIVRVHNFHCKKERNKTMKMWDKAISPLIWKNVFYITIEPFKKTSQT